MTPRPTAPPRPRTPDEAPDDDSSGGRRRARGRITVVQEQRFLLLTEDGRGLLFTLAARAAGGAERLRRLRDGQAVVDVEYSGRPGLESAVAHRVKEV